MSNKALTWAFSQDLKSGPKFVLVALADYADEANSCYPSYKKISAKTGISARSIAEHMTALEDAGLLRRQELRYDDGKRSGYRFFLNLQISQVAKSRTATCEKRSSHLRNPQDNNHQHNPHNNLTIQTRASADVGAGLNKAVLDQIHERWNAMAGEHSFPLVQRMTQDRIRLIKTRLAESGGALAPILTVIERVPLMCGWQGGGKRGHITFDWILGPPRDGRPDRFLEALEFNPQTPKAENVQLNPNSYDAKQAVLIAQRRERTARAIARRQSNNSGQTAEVPRLAI